MTATPEFDIIVYGATGFTGRLVAEYLAQQYGQANGVSWAMAGRSAEKLSRVRDEIGAAKDTPLLTAEASDRASLEALAARTKSIVTTVGPYQLYGNELLEVCVQSGTDYLDLCGEPAWMRHMIEAHEKTAAANGARIVFSCGFDSIPFDLGVHYLQQNAIDRFGKPCSEIKGRVRKMHGTFSGGTAASLKATMAAAMQDPAIIEHLKNPFALAPGFEGPRQPSGSKPIFDESIDAWCAPFIMAPINTKNIHRTNFLMDHIYGAAFKYSEMIVTGKGDQGEAAAKAIASDTAMIGDDALKPGEGPSKEERDAGHYDILFLGISDTEDTIKVGVTGDKDPGYGSTSKMIAEAAICLTLECADAPGGIWSPASILGGKLIDRLQQNAGLTFSIE